MLIPKKYFDILDGDGRSLKQIGVNRVALPRSAALAAIEALRGSQVAILGGDVLRLVNDRPSYTLDNWYSQRKESEPIQDFLRRSWDESERYIRAYPDPEDATILYTLVESELGLP